MAMSKNNCLFKFTSLEIICLNLFQIAESCQALVSTCNAPRAHNDTQWEYSISRVHITHMTSNHLVICGNSTIYNSRYPCWGTKGTFRCTVWQGGQTVAQSSLHLQDLKKGTGSLEALVFSVFLREQLLTELNFFACRAYACVSNGEPDLEVSQANYNRVTWSFMNTGGESRWCWGNGAWKLFVMVIWMRDSESKIPDH